MFRGATNPYDEIVVKATDENQTSENWEIILNLCDKVADEGEQGSRNVIAALLKRLAHRNANVQLYSLALAESLSKNCGIEVHRELASRAFTQGLEKLVTDRTGHEKVKKKAILMIQNWANEWKDDPTLGIMNECYESLKSKNIKFEQAVEPPPLEVESEIRRQEEEELQRVLELSMQDKGGRSWAGYNPSPGASSSKDNLPATGAAASSSSKATATKPQVQPGGGYAASSARRAVDVVHEAPQPYKVEPSSSASSRVEPAGSAYHQASKAAETPVSEPHRSAAPVAAVAAPVTTTTSTASMAQPTAQPAAPDLATATRVRALHNFEPAAAGELAFEKGDVIKVVDRTHKDWWKGQLKGRTGIFPVNYVEPMPEPTVADLAREAEAEASIFAQAANIDRLLGMLRGFDIGKDNLADNDEIQELYRSSLGVRPKIIRLIEKYNQKKVELALMNENFVNAKELFDRMMEESLAKHNPNAYDFRRHPTARPAPNGEFRPGSTFWPGPYQQGPQQQGPPNFYPAGAGAFPEGAPANYPPQVYPQMDPAAYAAQQQYAGQDPNAYAAYMQQQQQQQQQHQQPQPYDPNAYAQHQGPQQAGQPLPATQPGQGQPGYDPNAYAQQQGQPIPVAQPGQGQPGYDPNAYAQQQGQPIPAAQPGQGQVPGQPAYDPNAYPQQQQQQAPQGQPAYDPNAYAQQQGQTQPQGQPSYDPNSQVQQPGQHQPAYDPNAYGQQTSQQPGQGQPAYDPNSQAMSHGNPSAQQFVQPSGQSPNGEQPSTVPTSQPASLEQTPAPENQNHQVGPPYVYDPNGQYPDPNAQAWAQYYAQGGVDPQGAVYFHSVPGVKEPVGASPPAGAAATSPQEPAQQMYSMQPAAYEQPQQQQPQQQQQQQPVAAHQPTASLSPKSAVNQLKSSPKSSRMSMAGVGTLAGHPSLKDHLPTYGQERGKRPSSAGEQAGVAVGSAMVANPWGGPQQPMDAAARAASPGGSAASPWTHQGPQIIEPTRTDSTSPPFGYGPPHAGHHAAVSPGGSFKPASAGPEFHSNQVTPYPVHRPSNTQQQSYTSGHSGP